MLINSLLDMTKINPDRWKQRFSNYQLALIELTEASEKTSLNKLEKQGLIKAFEYTFELGWKTLQDYIQCIGIRDIVGPRPVLLESFKLGLISNGEKWLELLEDRNSTSHTYNKTQAEHIINEIVNHHLMLFKELEKALKNK